MVLSPKVDCFSIILLCLGVMEKNEGDIIPEGKQEKKEKSENKERKGKEEKRGKKEKEEKNKLRILCLHGYQQSGPVFRTKIGSVRKFCSKLAEFIFITAPHKVDIQAIHLYIFSCKVDFIQAIHLYIFSAR